MTEISDTTFSGSQKMITIRKKEYKTSRIQMSNSYKHLVDVKLLSKESVKIACLKKLYMNIQIILRLLQMVIKHRYTSIYHRQALAIILMVRLGIRSIRSTRNFPGKQIKCILQLIMFLVFLVSNIPMV